MDYEDNSGLYIPSGLKTRTEIFDGFGSTELMGSILSTIVAGVLDIFIYLMTKSTTTCIIFTLSVMAASVMMQIKEGNMNLSVLDQTRNTFRFIKCQKIYPYQYLEEWDFIEKCKIMK